MGMPIDRFTFEHGRTRSFLVVKDALVDFFSVNTDKAFTFNEIYSLLNLDEEKAESIDYAIQRLEAYNVVRKYTPSGEEDNGPPYYKYGYTDKQVTNYLEAQRNYPFIIFFNFFSSFSTINYRVRRVISDWNKCLETNLKGALEDLLKQGVILSNEVCDEQICNIYYGLKILN